MSAAEREDFRLRAWERQTTELVLRLRSLADDVERAVRPRSTAGITGTGRHASAAEQVNHVIAWGIANASAYRLIDTAFHADEAEREAAS